jgi:hypothetical protein
MYKVTCFHSLFNLNNKLHEERHSCFVKITRYSVFRVHNHYSYQ